MIKIRKGEKDDLPFILSLIKELADYEKSSHKVHVQITDLEKDGFGHNPLFYLLVAEKETQIIGMALYYINYSTWDGKCLFLEDFIVKKKFRRNGVGKLLFEKILEIAKKRKLNRVMWQVLNWNKTAINFYKKYNAEISDSWLNGRLTKNQIQQFKL